MAFFYRKHMTENVQWVQWPMKSSYHSCHTLPSSPWFPQEISLAKAGRASNPNLGLCVEPRWAPKRLKLTLSCWHPRAPHPMHACERANFSKIRTQSVEASWNSMPSRRWTDYFECSPSLGYMQVWANSAPGSPHGFPPKLPSTKTVTVQFAGRPFLVDCGEFNSHFPFSRFRSHAFSWKHLTMYLWGSSTNPPTPSCPQWLAPPTAKWAPYVCIYIIYNVVYNI